MYSWYIKRALITSLSFLSALHTFSATVQWGTTHVIPEDSNSQVTCPVDHCYHLQDVLGNSSYFLDSHVTLELLPGMHRITENIGQLIFIEVENFILKGSSPNVTLTCQQGSSLGFTIINSQYVEISNIQISNCSAELKLEDSNNIILTAYHKQLKEYLKDYPDSMSKICDIKANSHPLRYTFLTSFGNKKLAIYKTAIYHSKGVGILNLNSDDLYISESLLAYNLINCIIFVLRHTMNTTFNMSQSQIEYGQLKQQQYKFASGMNMFVHVNEQMHNIYLTNITFINNGGAYGNTYLVVSTSSKLFDYHDHNIYMSIQIQITYMTSIQTSVVAPFLGYGLVIRYKVYLRKYDKSFFLLPFWLCRMYQPF